MSEIFETADTFDSAALAAREETATQEDAAKALPDGFRQQLRALENARKSSSRF